MTSDYNRTAAGSIMRLSAETHQSYKRGSCRGGKGRSCENKNITRDIRVVPGDGQSVAMGSTSRLSAVALRATYVQTRTLNFYKLSDARNF